MEIQSRIFDYSIRGYRLFPFFVFFRKRRSFITQICGVIDDDELTSSPLFKHESNVLNSFTLKTATCNKNPVPTWRLFLVFRSLDEISTFSLVVPNYAGVDLACNRVIQSKAKKWLSQNGGLKSVA